MTCAVHDLLSRMTALEQRMGNCELITSTANTVHKKVAELEQRVEQLEGAAVWTDSKNMENATAPVDTSWRPYDVTEGYNPTGDVRVVVMLRNGSINSPDHADYWDWGECEHRTIVAWRYAKDDE